MAACHEVVDAAAWVFQATAGGPGHLPIAQPPVGYRPAAAPAAPRHHGAVTAASAGSCSVQTTSPVVPYAAAAVYDMIAAAWTALCSSCGCGGDDGGTNARALVLALLSRLLTELPPRQAVARLPGLWREVLVGQVPALLNADRGIRTGELLRLQVPAPPQAVVQVVAAAEALPAAGPNSYNSYSLRCALDAGLLPALERTLRNEHAWVTAQGRGGSDNSIGLGGASGKGSSPSPVDASGMLHEINSTLRYSGAWPAALVHAQPAQVVGLVATLTAAARRLQQPKHVIRVGSQRMAGHMTMAHLRKDDAYAELCRNLAALLEQGLDLAADASYGEHSGASAPSGPSCPRRRRRCLRLNNALEPPISAPMQLGWLVAVGGAPPAGSAAAVQRDWLLALAVQQWLPLLLQYVGIAISVIQERSGNAAGAGKLQVNDTPAWLKEMAIVVLRATGTLLTTAAVATVQAAAGATRAIFQDQNGASGGDGAVADTAQLRESASSWRRFMTALADSRQLHRLVDFLAQHTELWAHSASGSGSTRCDGASRAGDADGRRPGGSELQDAGDGGGDDDSDATGLEGCVLDALEAFWLHRPQACANLMLSGLGRRAAPGGGSSNSSPGSSRRGGGSSSRHGDSSSSPSGGTQTAAQVGGGLNELPLLLPLREVAARHGRLDLVQLMEAASAAAVATTTAAAAVGTEAKFCIDFKPPAVVTETQLQRLVGRHGMLGEVGSDGRARRRAWRMMSPAEVQQQVRAALAAAAAAADPTAAPASSAGAAASGSGGADAASAAAAATLCANPACSSLEGPSALVLAGRGKTCSRCREARYCCGVCQLQHWREGGHNSSCAGVVAATAGGGSGSGKAGRAAGDSAVGPASSGPGRG
ncbi:hypothetical protein HXX76_010868 [Chlamydomonas incerta]|uniref:phytol kinase n=1 Tax=Chlamydomonas incerta TaxID=51695 RepID=A0A835SM73_CHLIN|nr:hypothetical protein HXX76_010868 [Chlamydomonas incerta]|eukprot:KAG2429638.1 hypothetical protein HXX76_010868 [Chlamydomonas incerta]